MEPHLPRTQTDFKSCYLILTIEFDINHLLFTLSKTVSSIVNGLIDLFDP